MDPWLQYAENILMHPCTKDYHLSSKQISRNFNVVLN